MLAMILPFFVFIEILGILTLVMSRVHFLWVLSTLRLSSSLVFLQELYRSSGSDAARKRSSSSLLEPAEFCFGAFNGVRFFMVFAMSRRIYGSFVLRDLEGNCKGWGEDTASNPDIVGSGVRLSVYLLFFAVFASLFLGSFHTGTSGTKELGVATLISTRSPELRKSIVEIFMFGFYCSTAAYCFEMSQISYP
jgi:hypothetical protein